MAKKRTTNSKTDKPLQHRAIAFRAPNQVHGALKQITGHLEMISFQIDGQTPYERDILSWLIGELYQDGSEKWTERLRLAHDSYQKFMAMK